MIDIPINAVYIIGGGDKMPKKKDPNFVWKDYLNEYIHTNIVYKSINFNMKKPDDVELLEWVAAQPEKVSPYLKRLVKEDMERNKKAEQN